MADPSLSLPLARPGGFSKTTLEGLLSSGSEPAESAAFRRRCFDLYGQRPWPTTEDEAWRRTELTGLPLDRFDLPPFEKARGQKDLPESFVGHVRDDEGWGLWGPDGFFSRLPASASTNGVLFMDLAEALGRVPERVWPALGKGVVPEAGKFAALSGAFWNRGLFVFVPQGVDATLVLRGGYAPVLEEGQSTVARTVVVAEAGSRLTFMEDHAASVRGDGASALSVAAVELVLGEGAQVTYVHFQRQARRIHHFLTQNAQLDRDARLTTLVAALGGEVSRADFGSDLRAPGAQAHLYGVVFGEGDQRFTHHARQHHRAPHTTSDLLFKSALMDRSRSVFTGLVRIEKSAAKSSAYQASKNILLSPRARANALPMLEILTDDVTCGHGAAVGGLDPDQRFYMTARGLTGPEAERAIVEGFFEDVLRRAPVAAFRDQWRNAVDEKWGRPQRG